MSIFEYTPLTSPLSEIYDGLAKFECNAIREALDENGINTLDEHNVRRLHWNYYPEGVKLLLLDDKPILKINPPKFEVEGFTLKITLEVDKNYD